MANAAADSTYDHPGDNIDRPPAALSWQTLRKLIESGAFNCQSCGLFFKTAVFCVVSRGTVCETCLNTNRWQGERLQFFDVALADLPVLPCTNAFAGCRLQVLPEDLDVHLENCKHRPIGCISPGCRWRGKQDDLVKHFEVTHRSDVINDGTTFDLDIGLKSFVNVKLVTQGMVKVFVVVRREAESDHISYNAFGVGNGTAHDVAVRHFCDTTEDFTKRFKTEELDAIDRTWSVNRVSLSVLREILVGGNKLHLKVEMRRKKTIEKLTGQTIRDLFRMKKGFGT